MAKFCTKCGAALKDGKCLKCITEKEEKKEAVKYESASGIGEMIKRAFTQPVTFASKETEDKNYGLAWAVMGIGAIIFGLLMMAIVKASADAAAFSPLSSYSLYGAVDIPYLKMFIIMAIAYVAAMNALIGFMYLFLNKVFKMEIGYKQLFISYQFSQIIMVVSALAAAILSILYLPLGIIVLVIGSTIGSVHTFLALGEIVDKKKNYLGYAYAISLSCTYIAFYIIGKIFS